MENPTCEQKDCEEIGNKIVLNGVVSRQCDTHMMQMIHSGIFITQLHLNKVV
jgi:hypothetical protein